MRGRTLRMSLSKKREFATIVSYLRRMGICIYPTGGPYGKFTRVSRAIQKTATRIRAPCDKCLAQFARHHTGNAYLNSRTHASVLTRVRDVSEEPGSLNAAARGHSDFHKSHGALGRDNISTSARGAFGYPNVARGAHRRMYIGMRGRIRKRISVRSRGKRERRGAARVCARARVSLCVHMCTCAHSRTSNQIKSNQQPNQKKETSAHRCGRRARCRPGRARSRRTSPSCARSCAPQGRPI